MEECKPNSDEELSREKKSTKSKKEPTKSKKNGKSKSVVESEDDGDHEQAESVDAGQECLVPMAKRDKDEEVDDCE